MTETRSLVSIELILDEVNQRSYGVRLQRRDDDEAGEGVDLSDVLRCVGASVSFTLPRGQ